MMQGDSYNIPIEILVEDGVADSTLFDDVEIVIGHLVKTLKKGEVKYDRKQKAFLFPLSQVESMKFNSKVKAQIRVKPYGTEDVVGIDLGEIDVLKTMSKAVL